MLFQFTKLACLATSLALLNFAKAQYVTTNGLQFELNGHPYSFAGTNSWTRKAFQETRLKSSPDSPYSRRYR